MFYDLWVKSMSFFNHWLEPTFLFWFENEEAKLFLIWVIFWISICKLSWAFRGKIDVSFENDFWLPKPARSAQTVENSQRFFNVPILDTNLCMWPVINWSALICGKFIFKKNILKTLLSSLDALISTNSMKGIEVITGHMIDNPAYT